MHRVHWQHIVEEIVDAVVQFFQRIVVAEFIRSFIENAHEVFCLAIKTGMARSCVDHMHDIRIWSTEASCRSALKWAPLSVTSTCMGNAVLRTQPSTRLILVKSIIVLLIKKASRKFAAGALHDQVVGSSSRELSTQNWLVLRFYALNDWSHESWL